MPGIGIGIGMPFGGAPGDPALIASQSFGVDIVASALAPLVASQGFSVDVTASASTIGPLDLLTIVTSVNPRFFLIGDLGVTGEGVGQTLTWADQSGNAVDYIQATDANKPIAAAHAAIGNRFAFSADGTNDSLGAAAYNLVLGDWLLFVFMQESWTISDTLFGALGTVSRYAIGQGPTATPNMRLISNTSATPANAGAAEDTWVRGRALCVNSTSAYLKLGSENQTGVAPGSGIGSTGRQIFGQNGGGFFHGKLALIAAWDGEPTELSAIDDWITDYYAAGVAVG
jgi:hypothetical protein